MSNPTGSVSPPRRDDDSGAPGEPSGDQPTQSSVHRSSPRDDDEVERLLADARVRVHQTLDESVAKAEELLAQRWSAVRGRLLAEVQQTLSDLAELLEGMGEVRNRLVRVEELLQEHDAGTDHPAESLTAGRRLASVPPLPDRQTLNVVSPETAETRSPTERPGDGQPTAGLSTAGGAEPAPAAQPQPRLAQMPSAAQKETEPEATAAPDSDTFHPDRGAVTLRVDPVAGFQELMRIQDVLGRLDDVRQSTVEAYEQGEARLRLELSAPTRPEEIATGLRHGLEQTAEVRAASTKERTLRIVLTSL